MVEELSKKRRKEKKLKHRDNNEMIVGERGWRVVDGGMGQ